jgi:high affinity Mn2+ porin
MAGRDAPQIAAFARRRTEARLHRGDWPDIEERFMGQQHLRTLVLSVLLLILAARSGAQQTPPDPAGGALPPADAGDATDGSTAPERASERFAAHGQATFVEQVTAPFHAPYSGANSLSARQGAETVDMTLFLGARLWSGAEAWVNPEIDQGFGLDGTLGVAGFPSGAAYKVGRGHPYWRVPRLFMRQTVNLSGESSPLEADENQFAGAQSSNRWVFTVGKFSVVDVFDANDYAHDPRHDFLNWTDLDAGTFDYAADAWGYTVGGAAEWYRGAWTLRAGVFDLSTVPNQESLDPGFREFQWVGELERRHELMGMPGKALVTLYDSRGRMALLDQAISLSESTGENINEALVAVRQYRTRNGVSVDLAQQLSSDLGVFARAGKAGGNVEPYEFTDVDQTLSVGLSLKAKRWNRPQDTVGLAGILNGISGERERYLNAGGLGILVGDGQLPHPGREQIIESYYELGLASWAQLTLDYQYIVNPAYNADRGPVSLGGLRVHAQF